MQNNTDTAHTSDPHLYGITLLNIPQANSFGQIPYYMFPSGQTKTGSSATTFDSVKYRELGRLQVCGNTWSFPAYAGGKLYVRDGRQLLCVDLASK